jgi:hypothetical protein
MTKKFTCTNLRIYESKEIYTCEKLTICEFDNLEFDKKFTCTNLRIYESKEKSTFVKNVNLWI